MPTPGRPFHIHRFDLILSPSKHIFYRRCVFHEIVSMRHVAMVIEYTSLRCLTRLESSLAGSWGFSIVSA